MGKSKKIRGDQIRFHKQKIARKSRLKAAAAVRLADAEALLKAERFVGAVYLAGISLECALKYAICEKQRIVDLHQKHPDLTAAKGHDLQVLLDRSGLGQRMSRSMHEDFVKIKVWNVGLRYNPTGGNVKDARKFVARVRCIKEWIEGIVS